MHASRTGSISGAISRDSRRKWAGEQQPVHAGKVVAGTVIIPHHTEKRDLLALDAGCTFARSDNEPEQSHRQAQRLPVKSESSLRLAGLRRGKRWDRAAYEILEPMGPPTRTDNRDSDVSSASSEGVSAFVARVLDQLALSAWLPAAFLTAGTAVLLEFRSTKSASIPTAVEKLTSHSVPALVIMLPLLVIATVITQAFSFEAIRALEGYWGKGRVAGLVCRIMTWRHIHRKSAIIKQRRRASEKAFRYAVSDLTIREDDATLRVLKAVAAELSGSASARPQLDSNELQAFVSMLQTWRDGAAAWRLTKVDRLLNEQRSYPVDSRILPTKLGNVLRATEDSLEHAGDDVRSFALRQRSTVSRRIQMQHDQFRTRLDMYCTLVFVSVVLAIVAPVALVGRLGTVALSITTASFAVMAVVSYLAAIASANGYCTALKQMDSSAADAPDKG